MKNRALLLAVVLVHCRGSGAPVPSPAASPAPAAAGNAAEPGPSVGAPLPAFEAPDQDGRPQTFETLRGPNGLLLNVNRSVVW
jgi:hypothetical protein